MAIICRPGVRGGAGRGNLRPGRFHGRQNASASKAVLQYYAILLLRIGGGATGFSWVSGRQLRLHYHYVSLIFHYISFTYNYYYSLGEPPPAPPVSTGSLAARASDCGKCVLIATAQNVSDLQQQDDLGDWCHDYNRSIRNFNVHLPCTCSQMAGATHTVN
jgi:hypothetical protein